MKSLIVIAIGILSIVSLFDPWEMRAGIVLQEIYETPIKAELIWKIGSDKENEDFYKPGSIAVNDEGCVFIIDTKNSRVQCFSKEGAFLFSFAKYGQGPGELSKYASVIRILNDGNVYVLDSGFKVNIYDKNGKFLRLLKIDHDYEDIELIDGKFYFPACYMDKKIKTIHVFDSFGKKEGAFGIFVEPAKGIYEKINKEKEKDTLIPFFQNFPMITRLNDKELIYSLFLPYRLIKYILAGQMMRDISGDIDYANKEIFSIIYQHNIPFVMPAFPAPLIFHPIARKDGTLLVPFFKKERNYIYIDLFDGRLNLIRRYKVQDRICTDGNLLIKAHVDRENNLYCLIIPDKSDDLPHVVKYRLSM